MLQDTSCHQSSMAASAATDGARPVANGDEVISLWNEPSGDSVSEPPAEKSSSPFASDGNDDFVAAFMSNVKSRFPATDLVVDSCWDYILKDSLVRLPDGEDDGNREAFLALEDAKHMCSNYFSALYTASSSLKGLSAKRPRDDKATSSKRRKIYDEFSYRRDPQDLLHESHDPDNTASQDPKAALRHWLEVGMKTRDAYGGYSNADVLDGFHDVRRKAHAYLLETLQDEPCKVKLERRKVNLIVASLKSCSGFKSRVVQSHMDGDSVGRSELEQSLDVKDSELSSTRGTLKMTSQALEVLQKRCLDLKTQLACQQPFAVLGEFIARSVYSAVLPSMVNATCQASRAG